jgi:hypothetical protein
MLFDDQKVASALFFQYFQYGFAGDSPYLWIIFEKCLKRDQQIFRAQI